MFLRRRPGSSWIRGVVVLGLVWCLSGCESDPVRISGPTLAGDDLTRCDTLIDELPDTVSDEPRRSVAPDDAVGAAWGDPAIVLTCGGSWKIPATATCAEANGVGWWIPESEVDDPADADDPVDLTMTTIGWAPAVRVELPAEYRPPAAAMVDLAAAIKKALKQTEPCL